MELRNSPRTLHLMVDQLAVTVISQIQIYFQPTIFGNGNNLPLLMSPLKVSNLFFHIALN